MTVATVRAELETKLATVIDRTHSFAPDSVNPPAAFVGTMTYNPRAVFGGSVDMTAQVWVVLSRASDSERAAEALDVYIDGASSVIDALEGSSNVWDSLAVTDVEFPISADLGAGSYMAARFDCEIYT